MSRDFRAKNGTVFLYEPSHLSKYVEVRLALSEVRKRDRHDPVGYDVRIPTEDLLELVARLPPSAERIAQKPLSQRLVSRARLIFRIWTRNISDPR